MTPLTLATADGERLDAALFPHVAPVTSAAGALGIVVAHGFTGSWRRPAVVRAAQALARAGTVLAFDFRGHGRSTGESTVGDREVLDVAAAVVALRAAGADRVVTVGFSMGGCVVVRHAALCRDVGAQADAVVAVSAPARWHYRGTAAMRRVHWAIERRAGRLVAARLLGTRITSTRWDPVPESPLEVVPRVAPAPLLVVHGDRDPYLPVEHALALHGAAREPRELWLVPGYGHAEAAAAPELLERIAAHLPALVGRGARPEPAGGGH